MPSFERIHGNASSFRFPVFVTGTKNFAATGDWTPETGDVKLSLDGGDFANATNLPVAIGGAGSKYWGIVITAAEMSAAHIVCQIVDVNAKAIDDQSFQVETKGSSAAQHHPASAGEGASL